MVRIYQVEPTNRCNLECLFCPRVHNKREEGFMNLDLLDKIDWSATKYTELHFSGEPLLYPQLEEAINRLHRKGVKVGLSTNAILWRSQEKALRKLDMITVNEDEYRALQCDMLDTFDNIYVQRIGENYPLEDYSRAVEVEPPKCMTPFFYVSVQWDGDVVPCCKAQGKSVVFGNLYEQDFDDIIMGEERMDFLMTVGSDKNGLCEYCQYPNPHEIHKKLLELMK